MQDVTIRTARASDQCALFDLMRELGYSVNEETIGDRIAQLAEGASDRILVADVDGLAIGVIVAHLIPMLHSSDVRARITSFVVTEECRSKGTGSMLIEAVEGWAWANGCHKMELITPEFRRGAHKFYENRGYVFDEKRFIKKKPE